MEYQNNYNLQLEMYVDSSIKYQKHKRIIIILLPRVFLGTQIITYLPTTVPEEKLHDWIESSGSTQFRFRTSATRGRWSFACRIWISMFNLDLLIGNECKIHHATRMNQKCNKILPPRVCRQWLVRQRTILLFPFSFLFLGFFLFGNTNPTVSITF